MLPLLAAAIPSVVILLAPKNDVAQVLAAIFLPIALALFRCNLGMRQLQELCGDAVPAFRQLALGTAIVALMLFEGWMSICQFADDEPPGTLAVATLIYVAYLVAIATALAWPRRLGF